MSEEIFTVEKLRKIKELLAREPIHHTIKLPLEMQPPKKTLEQRLEESEKMRNKWEIRQSQ